MLFPVPPGLEDRILCLWTLEGGEKGRLPVMPDGCMDLVLRRGKDGAHLALAGLDLEATWAPVDADIRYFGIRLRPGVRIDPLGFRAQEIVGERADLAGTGDVSQRRWLREVERSCAPLECLCEGLISQLKAPDASALEALHCAASREDGPASRRTLQREVVRLVGIPPSSWHALKRVRRAAESLTTDRTPICGIAAELGFADQAHLTRETRRWFGLTPGQLRRWAGSYRALFTAPSAF